LFAFSQNKADEYSVRFSVTFLHEYQGLL